MTSFNNEFSLQQWKSKHKAEQDGNINDGIKRVAKDLARVEEDKKY